MKKKPKIKILEINNIDILGRRFNGYDLADYINNNTNFEAKQLVNLVQSKRGKSVSLYKNIGQFLFEREFANAEYQRLSVHSQLSISTDFLENNKNFKEASLVHFHMFHNCGFNLYSLKKIASKKPTIITFHDLWFLTGRCAQPFECSKWLDGCKNCEHLNTIFPMHTDNCDTLWNLKDSILRDIDIDVVVASPYMLKAIKERNVIAENKIHLIPFGLNLDLFYDNNEKENIKRRLGIPKENIVLFFRAQNEFKGTEYIIEALNNLESDRKITVISCSEVGLLESIKDRYQVIEMGNINTDKLLDSYRACDIFMMTSKAESFGLMAIEAMACSRPVIVFDNTALPYVTFAPECGVLVENRNSDKLREALEELIFNEKDRLRRGKLGRKLAEENYNINEYNIKMVELYKKVLKRKHKINVIKEKTLDYNDKDVQELLYQLNKITKDLFGNIPNRFKKYLKHKNIIIFRKTKKINYANENVQKAITKYNTLVYKELKENPEQNNSSLLFIFRRKLKTLKFLLINDRKRLLSVIKSKRFNNKGGNL